MHLDKTDHLHGNKSNVNRIDLEFAVPQNFFTHDHGYAKNINSLSNYHSIEMEALKAAQVFIELEAL